jgi:hypothetical protein
VVSLEHGLTGQLRMIATGFGVFMGSLVEDCGSGSGQAEEWLSDCVVNPGHLGRSID